MDKQLLACIQGTMFSKWQHHLINHSIYNKKIEVNKASLQGFAQRNTISRPGLRPSLLE